MLANNYNIPEIFRNIKKKEVIIIIPFENSILNFVKSFLKTKLTSKMSTY